MTSSKREIYTLCLQSLCPTAHQLSPESARLAGHVLRDFVLEGRATLVTEWLEAAPWLSAFVALSEMDADVEEVCTDLEAQGALHGLHASGVRRSLLDAMAGSNASTGGVDFQLLAVIAEFSRVKGRILALGQASPAAQRASIYGDTGLLLHCMGRDDDETPLLDGLQPMVNVWERSRRNKRALEALAELEERPTRHWTRGLGARARRFEARALRHLADHDCLLPIRIALSLPISWSGVDRLDESIVGVLDEEPGHRALCEALVAVRGRAWEAARGAFPLASLSPWVAFLRGPLCELSEARGWSVREGLSFAHYCFHTMNVCDLMAHRVAAGDEERELLIRVEDEVKEFVWLSMERSLRDDETSLSEYETVRSSVDGHLLALTDRITRLVSCPTSGSEPTTPYSTVFGILSAWEERTQGQMSWSLSSLLQNAHIVGADLLERLEPTEALGLLVAAIAWIRDGGRADISKPFRVDLRPLRDWALTHGQRLDTLRKALVGIDLDRCLFAEDPVPVLGYGLTLHVSGAQEQWVEVCFVGDAEAEAMMTLLEAEGLDPALANLLEERLVRRLALLQAPSSASSSSWMTAESAIDPGNDGDRQRGGEGR